MFFRAGYKCWVIVLSFTSHTCCCLALMDRKKVTTRHHVAGSGKVLVKNAFQELRKIYLSVACWCIFDKIQSVFGGGAELRSRTSHDSSRYTVLSAHNRTRMAQRSSEAAGLKYHIHKQLTMMVNDPFIQFICLVNLNKFHVTFQVIPYCLRMTSTQNFDPMLLQSCSIQLWNLCTKTCLSAHRRQTLEWLYFIGPQPS